MPNISATIRGEKTEARKEEADFLLGERRYGAFHRGIPLRPGADHAKVGAHIANGVLTVSIPKTAEAKEK